MDLINDVAASSLAWLVEIEQNKDFWPTFATILVGVCLALHGLLRMMGFNVGGNTGDSGGGPSSDDDDGGDGGD